MIKRRIPRLVYCMLFVIFNFTAFLTNAANGIMNDQSKCYFVEGQSQTFNGTFKANQHTKTHYLMSLELFERPYAFCNSKNLKMGETTTVVVAKKFVSEDFDFLIEGNIVIDIVTVTGLVQTWEGSDKGLMIEIMVESIYIEELGMNLLADIPGK